MRNFLEANKDIGILILRVTIGCAFALIYGKMKIEGGSNMWTMVGSALTNFGITSGHTFWGFMATISEFGGGILLILGLFTRSAVILMAFTMIIAASTHLFMHDQWYNVMNPINMLAVFIALLFLGAGKYSLDYILFHKKAK